MTMRLAEVHPRRPGAEAARRDGCEWQAHVAPAEGRVAQGRRSRPCDDRGYQRG